MNERKNNEGMRERTMNERKNNEGEERREKREERREPTQLHQRGQRSFIFQSFLPPERSLTQQLNTSGVDADSYEKNQSN